MHINNISSLPAVQGWLQQFLPKDRPLARIALDNLVYVKSDTMQSEIYTSLEKIIEASTSVAIFPVRELLKDIKGSVIEESYFPLDDRNASPIFQPSGTYMGSESYISNIAKNLERKYKNKISLSYCNEDGLAPSINTLQNNKTDELILIDDLIGSGKRTCDFLNVVYAHPTIKSWISTGHLKIRVIAFMATDTGEKKVSKWVKSHKAELNVLYKCPTFNTIAQNSELLELFETYANKRERYPLGFGKAAVRVVFGHSAPNNLPSIFFRNIVKYTPKNQPHYPKQHSWEGLFPKRVIQDDFKYQVLLCRSTASFRKAIHNILQFLSEGSSVEINSLTNMLMLNGQEVRFYVDFCKQYKLVTEHSSQIKITTNGVIEMRALNNVKHPLEFNKKRYYPPLFEQR